MEPIFNPYLPLTEHIPDGEPHVFGDRLYIYGSHDAVGGTVYCQDHYAVWSAPVTDLRDWKYHGVSYLRTQDPTNADDRYQLWAPDVTRGPDGRYYLYYCFSFVPEIGVAVSDDPAGPFAFYGHVRYPDSILGGKTLGEDMPFDPAVLTDDDGRVYLYYGFCPAEEKEFIAPKFSPEELAAMPPEAQERVGKLRDLKLGEYSMVAELEQDMLTLKERPRPLIPGGHHTAGTGFEGHGFFEASSIRKIRGKYYFVYSSHKSHELCYAVSDRPDRDFRYGGILISNGDVGLDGRTAPTACMGNNHGGLAEVGEDLYIFYHRPTDGTEFSRQGCAEKVTMAPDGSIAQVGMTSCGLNGGPLPASGCYPAAIACHLTDPTTMSHIDYADPVLRSQIRVTQRQNTVYVTGIKDGAVLGWKYFDFDWDCFLLLEVRGDFRGRVSVSHGEAGEEIGGKDIAAPGENWVLTAMPIRAGSGAQPLYLRFTGRGTLDLKTLAFRK